MRYAAYSALALASLCGCGKSESTPDEGAEPSSAACDYDGQSYEHGARFPARDGCNRCSCDDGSVACTEVGCQRSCEDIARYYGELIERLKLCDPTVERPCSRAFSEGLACGCATFINSGAGVTALEAMAQQEQYAALDCGVGIQCGECTPPIAAHCSDEGRCVDDDHPACKVGGKVYPSGATGIQDPFSCNECACNAGALVCTEIACERACPPNGLPGQTCAECGLADECLVVEHACLPVCQDTCSDGATCVNTICKNLCG